MSQLELAVLGFVVFTAGIAILTGFFGRKARRESFPGGPGRYFAALSVQAFGFVLPVAAVWHWLRDAEPQGLGLVAAFVAGMVAVAVLRYLPVTGPLLTDLAKAPQPAGRDRKPAP